MRTDSAAFTEANSDPIKSLRYTIEVSFDDAYTDLYYFTSHPDSATPDSVTVISNVVQNVSVTSQQIQPEKAIASIGSISFDLIDLDNQIRFTQASELALGNSLKHKRVRVYVGFEDQVWSDYALIQTQIIDEVTYKDLIYKFSCSDVQRLERTDIFDLASTTLALSISATPASPAGTDVITVFDTSLFEAVEHSASWTDAPSEIVYYFKIESEVIRATGKTATTFTGCTRGALNTRAAAHAIDPASSADRRTEVEEYIYLEMPAPKMIYALMTGIMEGDATTLPDSWSLGISTDFVRLSDFTGIGDDLWDLTDDVAGVVARFEGEKKQDGKQFIEEQLNLLIACFNPIYGSGELGLRRMTPVVSDAAPVLELTEADVVSHSNLTHSMKDVKNYLKFLWNWEPIKEDYTRRTLLVDAESISLYKQSPPKELKFRGVSGQIHTTKTIEKIFDSLRDRFSAPPLLLELEVLFSNNALEIGDVVKVTLDTLQDYNSDSTLDRSFEIQQVSINWIKGTVNLRLFGSAAKAGTIVRSDANTVLLDSYYSQCGKDLKTYIGGGYDATTDYSANHIISSCQLTGSTSLTDCDNSVYYHEGDLTIDFGVDVTITSNVQLRVQGFLTVNGTINGIGQSGAGGSFRGYVGATYSGGGVNWRQLPFIHDTLWSDGCWRGTGVTGLNSAVPELTLEYFQTTNIINGLPNDLRGTRGASGHSSNGAGGGGAGTSGSGLLLISRGLNFGASGNINLSGTNGGFGAVTSSKGFNIEGGAGAGGASGSVYVLLDGSDAIATYDETNVILCRGSSPRRYRTLPSPGGTWFDYHCSAFYTGFAASCSFQAQQKVQYIPAAVDAEPDPPVETLAPPTDLVAVSGTDQLLVQPDGTVTPRILLSYTPTVDTRAVGYEVQYKESVDSLWISSTNILGIETASTFILGVVSNVFYDLRIRSAASDGTTSEWAELLDYLVVGKTEPPSDVITFTASLITAQVVFNWEAVTDPDIDGYEIRYVTQASGLGWAAGVFAISAGKSATSISSTSIPDGVWKFMIKAVDTTGNYSLNEASSNLTVTSNYTNIIETDDEFPLWTGTLTNMIKLFDDYLIPDSQQTMDNYNTWAEFESANPDPFANAYYEIELPVDITIDALIRVWSLITSQLAVGESSTTDPVGLDIDYRVDAGSYAGFIPWSIGEVTARHVKYRIHVNTVVAIPLIFGMVNYVDARERAENGVSVIGIGGTTVSYADPFFTTPLVTASAQGAVPLTVTRSAITSTSFLASVFDSGGIDVGGTIDWTATGV